MYCFVLLITFKLSRILCKEIEYNLFYYSCEYLSGIIKFDIKFYKRIFTSWTFPIYILDSFIFLYLFLFISMHRETVKTFFFLKLKWKLETFIFCLEKWYIQTKNLSCSLHINEYKINSFELGTVFNFHNLNILPLITCLF